MSKLESALIKLELSSYYDAIKNEIDLTIEKHFFESNITSTNESIQEIYEFFIQKIDNLLQLNMNDCNSFFQMNHPSHNANLIEELKLNMLNKYCFYINNTNLKDKDKNALGILIVADWYLNEIEQYFIR